MWSRSLRMVSLTACVRLYTTPPSPLQLLTSWYWTSQTVSQIKLHFLISYVFSAILVEQQKTNENIFLYPSQAADRSAKTLESSNTNLGVSLCLPTSLSFDSYIFNNFLSHFIVVFVCACNPEVSREHRNMVAIEVYLVARDNNNRHW